MPSTNGMDGLGRNATPSRIEKKSNRRQTRDCPGGFRQRRRIGAPLSCSVTRPRDALPTPHATGPARVNHSIKLRPSGNSQYKKQSRLSAIARSSFPGRAKSAGRPMHARPGATAVV